MSQFVERYRHGAPWDYDHPLEERALARGCGVIVWQEQVVQLIMDVAERMFAKINGQYTFPESHSHAFAVTAYQAALLKRFHPVVFFASLANQQPIGFYPVETLKQDVRRFGVPIMNPCVNRSGVDCVSCGDSVLLGLRFSRTWARRRQGSSWRSGSATAPTSGPPTCC